MEVKSAERAIAPAEVRDGIAGTLLEMLVEEAAEAEFESLADSIDPADRSDLDSALRVRAQQRRRHQRERELLLLLKAAQSIARLEDPAAMAAVTLRTARQLAGDDLAWLVSPSGACRRLGADGDEVTHEDAGGPRLADLAICVAAADSQVPQQSIHYLRDPLHRHDEETDLMLVGAGVSSVLAVPAGGGERGDPWVLGVASAEPVERPARVVALLTAVLGQATATIEAAEAQAANREELAAACRASSSLQARQEAIEAADSVQADLVRLAGGGDGLEELVAALSVHLDATVTVVDEQLNLLAHQAAASVGAHAELTPAVVDALALAPHGTARAVDGAWVAFSDGSCGFKLGLIVRPRVWPALAPVQSSLVARAISLFSLAQHTHERVRAAEQRASQELLLDLVRGRFDDLAALRAHLAGHGLDFDAPLAVIAVHTDGGPRAHAVGTAASALREMPAIVGIHADQLLALVGEADGDEAAERIRMAFGPHRNCEATVAVAAARDGGAGIAEAARRALQSLRLLLGIGREGCIAFDRALQPYAMLFSDLGRAQLDEFVQSAIGDLLDHDESRQAELARTLLVYLDLGRNTTAASAELHVHPNTLRQRLDRVDVLLPDWREPNRALEVHLALRMDALKATVAPA